jgi:hypothetical protein
MVAVSWAVPSVSLQRRPQLWRIVRALRPAERAVIAQAGHPRWKRTWYHWFPRRVDLVTTHALFDQGLLEPVLDQWGGYRLTPYGELVRAVLLLLGQLLEGV